MLVLEAIHFALLALFFLVLATTDSNAHHYIFGRITQADLVSVLQTAASDSYHMRELKPSYRSRRSGVESM